MAEAEQLAQGRLAFARQQWKEAYRHLCAVDAQAPLEPADLERLAVAAYLVGRDADATAMWRRAHHSLIDQGRPERAARCGFWLSFHSLLSGDGAQCTGWLARTQRLLADHPGCGETIEYPRRISCTGNGGVPGGRVASWRLLLVAPTSGEVQHWRPRVFLSSTRRRGRSAPATRR